VVELSSFEFLDRVADLVPPPRKHRHRYHGAFAQNHRLWEAVTSLAIGNIGKRDEEANGGHAVGGRVAEGCGDKSEKPRSHDTSRIAWAKLLARVGEEFPLECPNCGGDIRLIAFITDPGSSPVNSPRLPHHSPHPTSATPTFCSRICGIAPGHPSRSSDYP